MFSKNQIRNKKRLVSYLLIEHFLCLNYIKIKHSSYSLSLSLCTCINISILEYIRKKKKKANQQDKMKNLLLLVVFIGILYSGECFFGGIRRK